jgi:hypothetical protein
MQQFIFCHNWHNQNDEQHNLSQWCSAMGRYQTYPFTLHHWWIVTDCTTQKELAIHKFHIIHYSTPPENPDTLEITQTLLKSTQTIKKETTTEKERFFITNISKGYKITDLTRPNKLGTTTGKAATKSTGRSRLWKRLHAPSHNTAEDNQLRYTIFFKGRT